jgi:hypothetical protein
LAERLTEGPTGRPAGEHRQAHEVIDRVNATMTMSTNESEAEDERTRHRK